MRSIQTDRTAQIVIAGACIPAESAPQPLRPRSRRPPRTAGRRSVHRTRSGALTNVSGLLSVSADLATQRTPPTSTRINSAPRRKLHVGQVRGTSTLTTHTQTLPRSQRSPRTHRPTPLWERTKAFSRCPRGWRAEPCPTSPLDVRTFAASRQSGCLPGCTSSEVTGASAAWVRTQARSASHCWRVA